MKHLEERLYKHSHLLGLIKGTLKGGLSNDSKLNIIKKDILEFEEIEKEKSMIKHIKNLENKVRLGNTRIKSIRDVAGNYKAGTLNSLEALQEIYRSLSFY